ncbi:MAG TPA: sigma-70 family RNA polymerase sigma factor [Puia sp.]|nr:sigma-70 family RNA polymerase sigma factor [Puia sp.]
MKSENQIEISLWMSFKNGNRNAFAEIYKTHIHSLLGYGIKLCSDQEILKDNIQDLFIELWNGRENLANVECLKFYLIKSLRYKLVRAERKRLLQINTDPINDENVYKRVESSVESEMIEKETRAAQINTVRKAINILSKRQQEVIQLRFYQGFTNEQIAELMQMNYQSVSNLIYSSLCRIKKNLSSSPVFTTALVAAFSFFV